MGSYLSIVNNTQDTWHCRLSADESALAIFKTVLGAAGAAAASIGGLGGGAAPGSTLATITNAAGVASTVIMGAGIATDFAGNIIKGLNGKLVGDGYFEIAPGQKHRWGKMTLSLWQQGTCVRVYKVDDSTVRTDTLYMRPIFSGSLADSNRDHDIQWWINKNGVESSEVKQDFAQDNPRGQGALRGGESTAGATEDQGGNARVHAEEA